MCKRSQEIHKLGISRDEEIGAEGPSDNSDAATISVYMPRGRDMHIHG